MTAISLPVLLARLCAAEGWEVLPREDGARWLKSVAFETGLPFEQVVKCAVSLDLWPYTPAQMMRATPRPTEAEARERLGEWLTAGLAETGVPEESARTGKSGPGRLCPHDERLSGEILPVAERVT